MTRRGVCVLIVALGMMGVSTPRGSSQQPPVVPGGVVLTLPLGTTSGFVPPAVVIVQGTQLQYGNADVVLHDLVSTDQGADGQPLFASQPVRFGQTQALAGTETLPPGTYGFICTIYPSMEGQLHVVGPPANARPPQSESNGSVSIARHTVYVAMSEYVVAYVPWEPLPLATRTGSRANPRSVGLFVRSA